ncbi:MAG: HNH endonuclease [Cryobacterium sp.]|nr:HNH endonuclease [Cryobacterium sp.]
MKIFVGVTDRDWIRSLSTRDDLDQANFWLPSAGQGFGALKHGELFLFKSKANEGNQLVGAGVFDDFVRARVLDAWDWFGVDNGVASLDEFVSRIRKYRNIHEALPYDAEIGCVLLRMVEFFPAKQRVPAPSDWSAPIVRGKRYDTNDLAADHSVVRAASQYLRTGERLPDAIPEHIRELMFGDARFMVPRLGQGAFKAVIARNYGNRCAITGDKVRPVLQAAHILPVAFGGIHRPDNGLLLRSDMHTLYDRGYIGIDPKLRLNVSPRLREEFGNGDYLYARAGTEVAAPARRSDRPNREFLEWHMETVFRGVA